MAGPGPSVMNKQSSLSGATNGWMQFSRGGEPCIEVIPGGASWLEKDSVLS